MSIKVKLQRCLKGIDGEGASRVLYVTGLAGSGKTTVAQLVAHGCNAVYLEEFCEPMPPEIMETRVESDTGRKIQAQRWILGQCAMKDELLKVSVGTHVVDRTWLDAAIYARVYGKYVLDEICLECEQREWHPGAYLVLYASEDTCMLRLRQRNGLSDAEWENGWAGYIRDLRRATIEVAAECGLVTVDTTNMLPKEVAAVIAEFWKQKKEQ